MIVLKVLYVLIAYLYGSLPVTEGLAKKKGLDLRKIGTGKVGSGNLWQTSGASNGMFGGLFDIGKSALPALLAGSIGLNRSVGCVAAIAGLAAQMWPVFRKFDGGRGNSPVIGLALALSPRAFVLSVIPVLATGAMWAFPIVSQRSLPWRARMKFRSKHSDEIPIGMLTAWIGLPLFAWIMKEPKSVVVALAVAGFMLVFRRATDKLSDDIKSGKNLNSVILNKIVYDRTAR